MLYLYGFFGLYLLTSCITTPTSLRLEELPLNIQKDFSLYVEKNGYKPLLISINKSNLHHNLKQIKKRLNKRKFCAVVKSDAYGHGLDLVAPIIAEYADAFCITENVEALTIRNLGLKKPFIRLKLATLNEQIDALNNQLDIEESIGSLTMAKNLNKIATKKNKKIAIHLILDSGHMGRNGFSLHHRQKTYKQIKQISQLSYLNIVGIAAHLPTAYTQDFKSSLQKVKAFLSDAKDILHVIKNKGQPPILHISNSSASQRLPQEIQRQLHLDRIGASLFGHVSYDNENNKLHKEVMQVYAPISAIIERHKGDTIGYGSDFVLTQNQLTANIGIGWLNIPKKWGHSGYITNELGEQFKFLGNPSMNITIIEAKNKNAVSLREGQWMRIFHPKGPSINHISKLTNLAPSFLTIYMSRFNAAKFLSE